MKKGIKRKYDNIAKFKHKLSKVQRSQFRLQQCDDCNKLKVLDQIQKITYHTLLHKKKKKKKKKKDFGIRRKLIYFLITVVKFQAPIIFYLDDRNESG